MSASNASLVAIGFTLISQYGFLILLLHFQYLVWLKQRQISEILLVINPIKAFGKSEKIYVRKFLVIFTLISFSYWDWLTVLTPYPSSVAVQHIEWICNANNSLKQLALISLTALVAHQQNICILPTIFLLLASYGLYHLSINFQSQLSKSNHKLKVLYKLITDVNLVNEHVGSLFLIYYVSMVSFYCKLPEVLMGDYFVQAPVVISAYFIISIFIWYLVAESDYKIKKAIQALKTSTVFIQAIQRSGEEVDKYCFCTCCCKSEGNQSRILDALHTMAPIGISCRFFNMTYPFFGSVSI